MILFNSSNSKISLMEGKWVKERERRTNSSWIAQKTTKLLINLSNKKKNNISSQSTWLLVSSSLSPSHQECGMMEGVFNILQLSNEHSTEHALKPWSLTLKIHESIIINYWLQLMVVFFYKCEPIQQAALFFEGMKLIFH